jgi:hypothetical protein
MEAVTASVGDLYHFSGRMDTVSIFQNERCFLSRYMGFTYGAAVG